MPTAPTVNDQVIEAVVSGPGGANRLFTCTGHALIPMGVNPGQTARETWTFLVGPAFSPQQFRRATATAAVAGFGVQVQDPTAHGWHNVTFWSVEADWDDESGRTEMRVEVEISAGPGIRMTFGRIAFSATVLAEL
jgi:hypothetical protein